MSEKERAEDNKQATDKKPAGVTRELQVDVPKSGVLVWDKDKCTGCWTCELACSLYHAGVTGRAFSRLQVDYHPFNNQVTFISCRQCAYPSCYYACPLRDEALCIDEATGARYINDDECIRCGACADACPFEPQRIKFNTETDSYLKCDLCRGREGGPICVEYCNHQSLRFVSKEER